MKLAIKGHPKRGNEVIGILEMLGGNNANNCCGKYCDRVYYINENGYIDQDFISHVERNTKFIIFSFEEFLEKFPYKVDDCVVNHKYGKGLIIQMLWIDNEIVYEIKFQDCTAYCKINELCKYNASKGLLLQELTEYLSHTTREELDKTMKEIKIALAPFKVGDKVIVKGYEKMGEDEVIYVFETYEGDIKYKTKNHLNTHYFMEDSLTKVEQSNKEENYCQVIGIGNDTSSNGINTSASLINEETMEEKEPEPKAPILSNRYNYAEGKCGYVIPNGYELDSIKQGFQTEIILRPIKPQYPKTYEECCEVIGINRHDIEIDLPQTYQQKMFNLFKLHICCDAYWKIAGDWKEKRKEKTIHHVLYSTPLGEVVKATIPNCIGNYRLDFPTEEMRDIFYENFKELIEQCKELL